jgi:hypothetical protein
MGEFILILVLTAGSSGAPTATSIMFPTEAACEHAKTKAEAKFSSSWSGPLARAVCVPRGTP